MTRTARTAPDVLADAARELAPADDANPLVSLLATGAAPREVFAALALEQHHIITGDRRSFLFLAERAAARPAEAAFFRFLAEGETEAFRRLTALTAACGLDATAVEAHEPRPGCQAYPAYAAWLALGAEPSDAVVALTANFAAWSGYCGAVAQAMRRHYGFADDACSFFDFFAEPSPEAESLAVAAVQSGLDSGLLTERLAHRYGRLLQSYELLFWRTLTA
ncbi:transcriptional regulator [Streptomyces sp. UNOC14_S4]|uniref:transcriptional regulator n=1 Tax=Streptomyces sp. UNOC14_S4 TaxID=2872340 RepID=UPI001E5B7530|nr:transcriptional regulator [Streptomyces sp. UNOC14_S4]MCC3767334.1 transcriptional regulator [Streptomyces sp. UNOC14_S4]